MTATSPLHEPTARPSGPAANSRGVSRRSVLQTSGAAAIAASSISLVTPAHAASANCLMVGGEGSTKALGRTAMPAVSGEFRVSLDYLYPAGTMSAYCVFSSFDGEYRGPQLTQTGDRLTVSTVAGSWQLDQVLTADEWHRVDLDFGTDTVAVLVDGQRWTAGRTDRFGIESGVDHTAFGWIGDRSSAGYNGTAYFDNLTVRKDDTVTFEQTFDDGAMPKWTQTATAGAGVFGLASPARNAEHPDLAEVTLELPDAAHTGGAAVIHVRGRSADDADVLVETASVELTVAPSSATVRADVGAYFTVEPTELGTHTITAVVSQGGVERTLTGEFVAREVTAPGRLELSSPLEVIFVDDHMSLTRHVYALDDTAIPAEDVTWSFSTEPADVVTVDESGVVTAVAAGAVTITGTASVGEAGVTDTVELGVEVLETAKTRASHWTTQRRRTASENIATFDWAKAMQDSAIEQAEPWLAIGHEKLWSLITAQTIPRSYGFSSNEQQGCLNCGEHVHEFGQYPYLADVWDKPWKLTCPSCDYVFPTNDFAAYYAGGLDRNGLFDPVLAKQHDDELIADGGTGNLVNVLYPDKGTDWGVDNGAGTVLDNGSRYTPIAYYTHWKLWHGGELSQAMDALVDAYLYTGDPQYATLGVVILDRVADVYPAMNLDDWPYESGYLNSNGNSSRGKVVGSIWETGHVRRYLFAYDAFYPALADDADAPVSEEALEFLDASSTLMNKTNRARIRRNIEDGLLRAILPAVERGEIRGNNGMHQATLAAAAVVLDHLPETQEWLDFNFATGVAQAHEVTGGNLGSTFVDKIDRDGNGTEAAPGYNSLWLSSFSNVADYLDGYRLSGLPNYDLYTNPKYLKMFDGIHPLTMLERYVPTIGDTGKTGNPLQPTTHTSMQTAFRKTERPEYAQVLHALNNHSSAGLRLGMFDADPEGIGPEVQAIVDEHGPWRERSRMLTGYGFAALRDGSPPPPDPTQVRLPFAAMSVTEQSKPTKYFQSNGTVQFEASAVGDSVTFAFELAAPVTETLSLDVWRADTYGVYSVAVDGEVTKDRFSFAGGGADLGEVAAVDLAAGAHEIRFELVEAVPGPKAGFRSLVLGESVGEIDLGTQRGTTVYFGRNTGHGHRDNLNLDHFAYGLDLLPDLGYPRYANSIDMHRKSLVLNTIAHNTVVVDDAAQQSVVVGFPRAFAGEDDERGVLQVFDIDTPQAYDQVDRYRRTTAQVRIDENDSYLVDLFRVRGGVRHLFSLHAMECEEVGVSGVDLVPQQDGSGNYVGSYAGSDVPYDDTVEDPTGHSYFFDVDRAQGDLGDFSAIWSGLHDTWDVYGKGAGATTDVTVRATLLGGHADVALASCEPPQNKPGNPAQLRYLLARSHPTDGASCFTTVLEAFRGERRVSEVAAVPVTTVDGAAVSDQDARAVRVTLADGRVDLIVNAVDPSQTYLVDGLRFTGRVGLLVRRPDSPDEVHLVDGQEFGPSVFAGLPALTGTITGFTTELSSQNSITVALDPDESFLVSKDDVVGRHLVAEDDGERNAVYRITAVESWTSTAAVLGIDNVTPVRSYVDPYDFDAGFVHDLAKGRSWRIPLRIDAATDAPRLLHTLLDRYGADLTRPGGKQLQRLVDIAAEHQRAGRRDAAVDTVQRLIDRTTNDEIRDQLTEAARDWFAAALEGWLRSLAD